MTFDTPTFPDAIPSSAPDADPLTTDPVLADPVPMTLPQAATLIADLRVSLTLDALLYIAFTAIALVLRLLNLGTIVLNDSESHEALAVFRALNPTAPGTALITHQPLAFTATLVTMLVGGDSNVTARLATALVGAVLVLIPLLFRRWIGRGQAIVFSGLLALSPVLLTASRTMSGSVWSIALGLIAVWLIGRFVEHNHRWFAILATTTVAVLVIATAQDGFLVALMLLIGAVVALTLSTDPSEGARVRLALRGWPWLIGLIASAIVLGVIGTSFWLNPQGLGAIGDTVTRGLRGFVDRPISNLFAFPVLISLFYEPVLWIFGLIGAWRVFRGSGSFIHRLFVGWLLAAIVLSFVYAGGEASNALWLTIPLIGLSTLVIVEVLTPVVDVVWKVPMWGPWLHALGTAAVLGIGGINLLNVAQQALQVEPALIPKINQPFRMALIGLALLLGAILYFLVGSIWGNRAALRGLLLGILIFFTGYSLSAGWNASVSHADDPRELWRTRAVSQNLTLLDDQLTTTSLRASGMRSSMAITVVGSDDSPIAWILHRFQKTTFVGQASSAITTPAVITSANNVSDEQNKPVLGKAYVGESFSVYPFWQRNTLQDWDLVAWAYDRESRVAPDAGDKIVLWVRSDVYGVPADSLTNPPSPAASGK